MPRFRKILLFLSLFSSFQVFGSDADVLQLHERIIAYEKPWDRFVRTFYGCPLVGEVSQETCRPALGRPDYGAFMKACQAAKKLYGLKGECGR